MERRDTGTVLMGRTFAVPIKHDGTGLSQPDVKVDDWIEVGARPTGVPGLIVTQAVSHSKPVDGLWQISQKATGRALGSYQYPTIAAARRAAQRVASDFDWTDPDLIYDISKPSVKDRIKATARKLRAESTLAEF